MQGIMGWLAQSMSQETDRHSNQIFLKMKITKHLKKQILLEGN